MPTASGPLALSALLELLGHDIEGLVPGDGLKLAFLIVDAAALAQEWRGQPVGAIHDLRQEIALDAVQTAIDRRIGVALSGHHTALLDTHQN